MPKRERKGTFVEDPVFAENNRTIHAHFTKRLSAFTSFDANLNTGYADAWQKAIDDFEAQPSDETEQDGVQIFTD